MILFVTENPRKPGEESDLIYVLDIDHDDYKDFELHKSLIAMPYSEFFHCNMVIMGRERIETECLVIGYIKKLVMDFEDFKSLRLPPIYIMHIIVKYHRQEMVYWIAKKEDLPEHADHYCQSFKSH